MKEQIRNTEVQINEEEIGKLPEKEFSQAPPSMGFSRQEYWSGVPSPSPV